MFNRFLKSVVKLNLFTSLVNAKPAQTQHHGAPLFSWS